MNKPKSRLNNKHVYIEPKYNEDIALEIGEFKFKPKISILIPVYNVEPTWLKLAIHSVEKQWYENWEICIVDDCSTKNETIEYLKSINNEKIKIKFLDKNLHISGASNEALELCSGEYVGLLDNDDELTVDALYEVVKKINQGYTFIYSDEDKLNMDGTYSVPNYKPDFARDTINSQNYICHFLVLKSEHIRKVSGFTVGLEGSQDHDLILKILDCCTDDLKIAHIPKILYHWRKIEGSTAVAIDSKNYAWDNGVQAISNSIARGKYTGSVLKGELPGTYIVQYDIIGNPKVSIIIYEKLDSKDSVKYLENAIDNILNNTSYINYEIVVLKKNTTDLSKYENANVKLYDQISSSNFAREINRIVAEYIESEYIVLFDELVEVTSKDWIEQMLRFAQREETGAVGGKLYYKDETIADAGIIIGQKGFYGHAFKGYSATALGYIHRLKITQNLSAVSGKLLMVSKEKFNSVSGLNEIELKDKITDVDFCLRLIEKGYVNLFNPNIEGIDNNFEDTEVNILKDFKNEVEYFEKRHSNILENGDPYYNENLMLEVEDFSYKIR